MKFLTISKFLMILILPFLLFLLMADFAGFDSLFYKEEFLKYKVQQNVPTATSLHEKVINFIKGENNELPNEFNEKEKQHLWDVRKAVRISTILLYILITLFILLLIASVFILKVSNRIINFVGKVLAFGGFLTVVLAAALFFFISSDFSKTFELFHLLFFNKDSYVFDPAKEIIVKIYPEQLFMDLGVRISKGVFFTSAIVIIIGLLLIFKSKRIKRINNNKNFHQ